MELYLGEAYHLSHKFDKAIEHLTLYRSTLRSSEKEKIREVDDLIQNCKNGIELVKTPVEVKIKNLGNVINSTFPDYMPALSADESMLIFTSRRDNSTGGLKINNLYFEDIYISNKKTINGQLPKSWAMKLILHLMMHVLEYLRMVSRYLFIKLKKVNIMVIYM